MTENQYDKKLKIDTTGRDDTKADEYHHPYEPTPYSVLERISESGYIHRESVLVDYGCGKGRVGYYLCHEVGCKVIGVEYDERIYRQAEANKTSYIGKQKPEFRCESAEEYEIEEADCLYFFNPFSVEILQTVLGKVMDSYYRNPREMYLFFYYPDDSYVSCLMTQPELEFVDEIECMDLFEGNNSRERILIFQVGG